MHSNLEKKFVGAMVGSALGDAIGELAFHHPSKHLLLEAVNNAETLIYTDDTAMAIGIAESLLRTGAVDQKDLGDTFSRNFHREPWRGYASGPPMIFSMVQSTGMSYPDAAKRMFGGAGSLGNGAAMRIAPLALTYYDSGDLREAAEAAAEVTHAHPVGKDGAAVLAMAVAMAVRADQNEPFPCDTCAADLEGRARTEEIRGKMAEVRRLIANRAKPAEAADRLGRTVAVHESMPYAVYSFLSHPESFEETLLCAVLNGGDRDTLGAMACAVSGAYLGTDAIPSSWQNKLENLEYIEDLARRLFRMRSRGEEHG